MGRFSDGPKTLFSRDRGREPTDGQPYVGMCSIELSLPDKDGDRWIEAVVEVLNPTTDAFEEVEVVVVPRDANGTPLGEIEGTDGPLPPKRDCNVKATGYVPIRDERIVAFDVYVRVVDIERVSLAADVQWED